MVTVTRMPSLGAPVDPTGLPVRKFRPSLPCLACEMRKGFEIHSLRITAKPPMTITPGPCALPHSLLCAAKKDSRAH